MHSFALLALASSAFALPLINPPVNAILPMKSGILANGNAEVPAIVDAGNVKISHLDAANHDLSGNQILSGDSGDSGYSSGYSSSSGYKRDDLVNAPAVVAAPVKALTGLNGEAKALVASKAGNVDVHKVAIGNGIGNGNEILSSRGASSTVPAILATAQTEVAALVSTIKALLASNPASSDLEGPLNQLNSLLASTTSQVNALKGLKIDILAGSYGDDVSIEEIAATVAQLSDEVAELLKDVQNAVKFDLSVVFGLLGNTLQGVYQALTSLLPTICPTLRGVLNNSVAILATLGIKINLGAAGM